MQTEGGYGTGIFSPLKRLKCWFVFFCVAYMLMGVSFHSMAQGGGPPMMNDDGDVTPYKTWEINVSFELISTEVKQISVPHVDLNYGILKNLQITAGTPMNINISNGHAAGQLGTIYMGVKYHFLDEKKQFISAAVFPQFITRLDQGWLLPLFVHKTFGKMDVGLSGGYFIDKHKKNYSQWGVITGVQVAPKFQLMTEYFVQRNINHIDGTNGFFNLGFRQNITDSIFLMGSAGRQLNTPANVSKANLLAWIGVRILI